jgi:hypothetical protein
VDKAFTIYTTAGTAKAFDGNGLGFRLLRGGERQVEARTV